MHSLTCSLCHTCALPPCIQDTTSTLGWESVFLRFTIRRWSPSLLSSEQLVAHGGVPDGRVSASHYIMVPNATQHGLGPMGPGMGGMGSSGSASPGLVGGGAGAGMGLGHGGMASMASGGLGHSGSAHSHSSHAPIPTQLPGSRGHSHGGNGRGSGLPSPMPGNSPGNSMHGVMAGVMHTHGHNQQAITSMLQTLPVLPVLPGPVMPLGMPQQLLQQGSPASLMQLSAPGMAGPAGLMQPGGLGMHQRY